MPAALAVIARTAIQAAITTGIWVAVDKILIPVLKEAVQSYMMRGGMTEEEAKDHVANDIIDMVATFGAIAVSIRSKFPTKAAEYLGFTSKGWSRRAVGKAGMSVAPKVGKIPVTSVTVGGGSAAIASVSAVSKLKGLGKGAAALGTFLEKRANTSFIAIIAVTGLIDFGNWETGAYSDFFQKVFAKVSGGLLIPNEDYRKTKTVSPEVFDKVFNTYKLEGAISINDPYKNSTVSFTRDNLIDLLDKVGADLLLKTGSASTKDVLEASQFLMKFSNEAVKTHANSIGYYGPISTSGTPQIISVPKVYTGIVSQGVLGRGLEFIARPDDLIENEAELRAAVSNNLAPFMQSIMTKIVYEIKIVNSIVTKGGFKQTGVSQQVKNGNYADGRVKYKTVYNKFAVIDLFIITDRGTRTKISTIVLGPTDSSKLNLNPQSLRNIEAGVSDSLFTSNISEITGIETNENVTISTPILSGGSGAKRSKDRDKLTTAVPESVSQARPDIKGLDALTLTDWFNAQGESVPRIEARAILYESLGLGSVNYYSGTSEQNIKLLKGLKIEAINERIKLLKEDIEKKEQREKSKNSDSGSARERSRENSKDDFVRTIPKSKNEFVGEKTDRVIVSTIYDENNWKIITYADGGVTKIKMKN